MVSEACYRHFSYELYRYANAEEVENLYAEMRERLNGGGSREDNYGGIFRLLWEYTKFVLKIENGQPVCRQEQLVEWRRCFFFLGQDLLTTAHMAYHDAQNGGKTVSFVWPVQIHTDDRRFHEIMRRGLEENHYHLNGSTRGFDISWICLMNHPKHIGSFFGKELHGRLTEKTANDSFLENLNPGVWYGTHDNKWEWGKRVQIASYVRGLLFRWLNEGDPILVSEPAEEGEERPEVASPMDEDIRFIELEDRAENAINLVWGLRCRYGQAGAFLLPGERRAVLDYAITGRVMDGMSRDNPYRMLAGERALLYDALFKIYRGDFLNTDRMYKFMDLFYLYLLLKVQFRGEIIQVNQRTGFHNFAFYQNRKSVLFEKFSEYNLEALRLSVAAGLKRENIKSLEMRIAPRTRAVDEYKQILKLDHEIAFVCEGKEWGAKDTTNVRNGSKLPYFFVLHFPKIKEEAKERELQGICRNVVMRGKTRRQAMAIADAMGNSSWLCTRIRGIDACTYEIGCRPEVFGTEFRFLRNFLPEREPDPDASGDIVYPRLSATYHVGEDFLDLADGLRAIDEAILFLELQRGDRLGHALALGVEPDDYYQFKHGRIVINKQDHLDNLVWMLYRAQSLNIDMPKLLYQRLKNKAEQLLDEIYGGNWNLQTYYNSWKLRGDDPQYYRTGSFRMTPESYGLQAQVQRYELRQSDELRTYRGNGRICELYYRYHFEQEVKARGAKIEVVPIDQAYVDLIRMIQDGLQREVSQRGIGIECNPSSNVLIGTFSRYRQHPIFRFNPVGREDGGHKIMVSVNTDDQGVFDTSLENEFGLLASCLCTEEIPFSGKRYHAEEIYEHTEYLRTLGFAQVFPAAHPR